MAIRRSRHYGEQDPFTDLLFNALLAFTFLFILVLIFLSPPAKTGIVDPKAEFIITTTWQDGSPDDIDTWVEGPDGQTVWFNDPSLGLMHLDRDDRGMANDTILVEGKEISNPLNQEVITIRGYVEGEYIVNLHYYASQTNQAVTASVNVAKVNPRLKVGYYGDGVLVKPGEEKTAVRFSVSKQGEVFNVNTLPKAIVSLDKL